MKIILIAFMLLAQSFPVPTTAPLPTAKFEGSVGATAQPSATPGGDTYQIIDSALSTVEAELNAPMQVTVPTQIDYLANAFGLIYYISNHAPNLFGVFAPLFQFLLYLTPIALILFLAYIGNLLVTTIYSIASDIYQKIRG